MVNARLGPTSMKILAPASYIDSTCFVHSTAEAICGASFSRIALFESEPPAAIGYHPPSTFDEIGIVGQFISKPSRNLRNGLFAGSTIREWKAWLVCNIALCIPASSNLAIACFTGSVSPAITVILGEFLFAAMTYPSTSAIILLISSNGPAILAISPVSAISTDPISVPRAAAARRAPSIASIPDDINAAYSPKECPATISGECPCALSNFSIAKSEVNIAG